MIVQLVGQLIAEAPTVIADIEALIAAAKGQAPATPADPPLTPIVAGDPLVSALETPIK